jgi:hypothetical protein
MEKSREDGGTNLGQREGSKMEDILGVQNYPAPARVLGTEDMPA